MLVDALCMLSTSISFPSTAMLSYAFHSLLAGNMMNVIIEASPARQLLAALFGEGDSSHADSYRAAAATLLG